MIRLRVFGIATSIFRYTVALAILSLPGFSSAGATEPDSFVVHEWGTFSTFSGSDGKPLKFTPDDTDLPPFVHNRRQLVKGGLADVLVSLETPVL